MSNVPNLGSDWTRRYDQNAEVETSKLVFYVVLSFIPIFHPFVLGHMISVSPPD